jgi:glyoxylase-like metal-dependent hydrolase (beta-lactamase superfamily II)
MRSRAQAPSGVATIALPTPWPVGAVNAYLIEDEPLTLVDTGPLWSGSLVALRDGLAARGYALGDLERVILTHQHLDHWGLAQAVVERSGADLYALSGLVDWLSKYPQSIVIDDALAQRVLQRHGASSTWLATVAEHNRQARTFGMAAVVTRRPA